MLDVYMPHAIVERVAIESGATGAFRPITLIDPMYAHDPSWRTSAGASCTRWPHRTGVHAWRWTSSTSSLRSDYCVSTPTSYELTTAWWKTFQVNEIGRAPRRAID
jgi:hypothetical protein